MAKRKTKVDPVIAAKIVEVLSSGATIKDTCAYVGIHIDTYYDWCNKFSEFSDAVEKARATAKVSSVAVIRKASQTNWTAAAWFLERSDPANWGRKDVLFTLGIDPALLKELKKSADSKGVSLPELFQELINEFANVDSTGHSEE